MTPSNRPLPILESLAVYDTSEAEMMVVIVGPTAEERVEVHTTFARDAMNDARRTLLETTQTGADFPDGEATTADLIQIGNGSCTFDGEEWTFQAVSAQEREIIDLATGLIDFTVVTPDATAIGMERIAGIEARGLRFTPTGVGQAGALVTVNEAEYWMDIETNALLRYRMTVETISGPADDAETETFRIEVSIKMLSTNSPVTVSFPADCPVEENGGGDDGTPFGDSATLTLSGLVDGTSQAPPTCVLRGEDDGTTSILTVLDTTLGDGTPVTVNANVLNSSGTGVYDARIVVMLRVGGNDVQQARRVTAAVVDQGDTLSFTISGGFGTGVLAGLEVALTVTCTV